MFNWLLSFFSSEAHIKHLVNQMTSAAKSVQKVKDRLVNESAELEYTYETRRKAIDSRFDMAERVGVSLASFVPNGKEKGSK